MMGLCELVSCMTSYIWLNKSCCIMIFYEPKLALREHTHFYTMQKIIKVKQPKACAVEISCTWFFSNLIVLKFNYLYQVAYFLKNKQNVKIWRMFFTRNQEMRTADRKCFNKWPCIWKKWEFALFSPNETGTLHFHAKIQWTIPVKTYLMWYIPAKWIQPEPDPIFGVSSTWIRAESEICFKL